MTEGIWSSGIITAMELAALGEEPFEYTPEEVKETFDDIVDKIREVGRDADGNHYPTDNREEDIANRICKSISSGENAWVEFPDVKDEDELKRLHEFTTSTIRVFDSLHLLVEISYQVPKRNVRALGLIRNRLSDIEFSTHTSETLTGQAKYKLLEWTYRVAQYLYVVAANGDGKDKLLESWRRDGRGGW